MVKVIMGLKGMGKTKSLIDMVNTAVKEDHGDVICIEKGTKLTYDIKYTARLIDISQFNVQTYNAFLAFLSGLMAGNHDITSIYIDSIFKFCPDNLDEFAQFLADVEALAEGKTVVITVSYDSNLATDAIKKYF